MMEIFFRSWNLKPLNAKRLINISTFCFFLSTLSNTALHKLLVSKGLRVSNIKPLINILIFDLLGDIIDRCTGSLSRISTALVYVVVLKVLNGGNLINILISAVHIAILILKILNLLCIFRPVEQIFFNE